MNNGIVIRDLTMRFRETTALENINLTLGGDKIYGLLGRNGAGKSTLLNCITNRLFPTQGEIFIDGIPARENDRAQSLVYYMGEKNFYPESTSVRELFRWTGEFYPGFDAEYAETLAEAFELNIKKKLKGLSTGYLTITKLICALAVPVPYLLFDEPVLGLDANHRELFYRKLLDNYSQNPRTIVISTHLIEEVADLIEQVVIIKKGRILLDRPAEEIRQLGYAVSGPAEAVRRWSEGRERIGEDTLGGLQTVYVLEAPRDLPAGLEAVPLDLQKLFIRLTNV